MIKATLLLLVYKDSALLFVYMPFLHTDLLYIFLITHGCCLQRICCNVEGLFGSVYGPDFNQGSKFCKVMCRSPACLSSCAVAKASVTVEFIYTCICCSELSLHVVV